MQASSSSEQVAVEEDAPPSASHWTGFRLSALAPTQQPKCKAKAKPKAAGGSKRKKDKENEDAPNVPKRQCAWINLNPHVVDVQPAAAKGNQPAEHQLVACPDAGEASVAVSDADQKWHDETAAEIRQVLSVDLPKDDGQGNYGAKVKEVTDAKQKALTKLLNTVPFMHPRPKH